MEGHCTVEDERAQRIRDRGRDIVQWRTRGHRELGTGERHCTVEDERAQRIRDRGRSIVQWRKRGHRDLGTGNL